MTTIETLAGPMIRYMWLKADYNNKDMKLNLNLNLGDGYLYGDATTESSSYKINIQQGWPDTALIMPTGLNQNPGQKSISFYTEAGNQIFLRGNLKNEDTDMIRLFTNMDTLVQLTKTLPTSMEIQDSEAEAH
jgi:hypothetical protein